MDRFQACKRSYIDIVMIESAQDMLDTLKTDITDKAKVFNMLGSEVRLQIIMLLLNIERVCVCDIADILEMKQSSISQHLRKLKDGGLLHSQREGMTIFYFIPSAVKPELEQIIKG